MRGVSLSAWAAGFLGIVECACVGGAPPECFGVDDCAAGQLCVEHRCSPDGGVAGDGGEFDGHAPVDGPRHTDDAPVVADVPDLRPAADGPPAADARASVDAADATPPQPADLGVDAAGAPEACNGVDDNGDGQIDEGNHLGEACVLGRGECLRAGENECGPAGGVICSAVPAEPQPELCDGLDNNCNGTIDEDDPARFCYPPGFDPTTIGVGLCHRGHGVCGPVGQAAACVGAVTPLPERCDGQDNDCDGAVDETFDVGLVCTADFGGGCMLPGHAACGADGAGVTCVADPAPPETCNNLDDNCDGRVDENVFLDCYDGPPDTEGVGICHGGHRPCKNGVFLACTDQDVPGPELPANGLDDNCDGQIDEPVP